MVEGGRLTVLDGSLIRKFEIPADHFLAGESVTGARIISEAQSMASSILHGLCLPENLKSGAFNRLDLGDMEEFRSKDFDSASAVDKVRDYLHAVGQELKDEPLVVSVLDGKTLRLILEDEDDFAVLAEDLFTDMDTEDSGKLHMSDMRNALTHMGVEMGVPTSSVSPDCAALIDRLLDKHGAEGDESLGQAQFANVLQRILQDLADELSSKHYSVITDIKVINGSKLKKILADEELLYEGIDRMFSAPMPKDVGRGSIRKIRAMLEEDASEFGLPHNDTMMLLYDQVFSDLGREKSEELNPDAFRETVKQILQDVLQQLQANPIFHEEVSS